MVDIESDWGAWLPRSVEAASPDTVAVWYLGCNGFFLKGNRGTTIAIDPYVGIGDPPRTVRMIPIPFDPDDITTMDAVLATHEHTDHTHGPSQGPILESTDAHFYGPDDSIQVARKTEAWQSEYDIDDTQFRIISEGETIDIGEFTVHVEYAHDPDSTHPVSYVIEHETGTFFHGGDTKPHEDFDALGNEYDIDLGVLAFGSIGNIDDKTTGEPVQTKWYATENEIIRAAADLNIDRLLPSHWDMWKGLTADPTALHTHARSYISPRVLEIAEIGDRINL
ncbi:MBL fold metallo-hydrolase [Haloquadratum walsbyi]|jgi:hypothetical protein|uniref:Putative Zn-dependent hydrolase n=1 Tax=Haloquadratum walsbyi J07HQW2 TaxID=1238425 RepID=U1MWH2_9EURY|nr:MBL fold metallo-hydrolase [Haloquadratum walsbyi]ERG94784.1 MAG: putative Zn-dependent hydrolase [Haloquadratum walsbyi J07HQW2]